MGGIVKSLQKAVGGLLGTNKQPTIVMPPAPPPAAVAAPEVAPVAAVEKDIDAGVSAEQATRKGKRGLTITRTPVGGGSGLNV